MSQANPFMITAVGRLHNFDKDQELYADELAVLRQKLLALKEALQRYIMTTDDDSDRVWGQNLLYKLKQFTVNLHDTNRLKVVDFVNEQKLLDADEYGKDVSQKATEFMRYWKEKAQPGAQV